MNKRKFPNNATADQMYSSIHTYKEDDDHRNNMIQKLNNKYIKRRFVIPKFCDC